MGIVMGLNSLIGNVPRYFLASDQGEALVGIFSALFYLTLPGGIVVTALCDSSIAQIAVWACGPCLFVRIRLAAVIRGEARPDLRAR